MSKIVVGSATRVRPSAFRSLILGSVPFHHQQQRCFGQTPPSQDQTPQVIFDTTDSKPLNKLLEKIQTCIILPSHLPAHQRGRLYKPQLKGSLKSDPIYIEIDGIEHRFSHIAREDIPATRAAFRDAIKLMETKEDWANLVRLLTGLQNAGRRLKLRDFLTLTRRAGETGQIYAAVDAARQVKKTGFKLDNVQGVSKLLFWVTIRAPDSEWDREVTEKSLRWSEMILDQVQEEAHQPTEPPPGGFLLHKDPQVLSAPLLLSAALAVKHSDEVAREKCGKYARQMVEAWPAGTKGLLDLYPEEAYRVKYEDGVSYLKARRTEYIANASTLKYGAELAAQVVEPELAKKLQAIAATLGPELEDAVTNVSARAEQGRAAYNLFFGEGAGKVMPKA